MSYYHKELSAALAAIERDLDAEERDRHDPIQMTWAQYQRGECTYHGKVVKLNPQRTMYPLSTELVSAMLMHRGQWLSRMELVELAYPDPDTEVETAHKNINVVIHRLKRKLPGLIVIEGHRYRIPWPDDHKPVIALNASELPKSGSGSWYRFVKFEQPPKNVVTGRAASGFTAGTEFIGGGQRGKLGLF